MIRPQGLLLIFVALLAGLGAACGAAPKGSAPARAPDDEVSVRPGVNETFLSEDLDVDRYVEIFETESREIYARRNEIVASLGLPTGSSVADIGAGTGLFMGLFAEAVGESGKVFAVDISPKFVERLRTRVSEADLESVAVVLGKERSVELAGASIDLAFVCDTYHHFEYPHSTLASLHQAIRPGGSLVVIDFERIPGESRDWVLEHVRAGKDVFTREIEAAGFELVEQVAIEGLKENYVLRFRRP